jgi:hypothetical protein
MTNPRRSSFGGAWSVVIAAVSSLFALVLCAKAEQAPARTSAIGREVAIARHLEDDDEFRIPLLDLIEHGRQLFAANWTDQEGGGRPLMKGTGKELTDSSRPLVGARAFNRN